MCGFAGLLHSTPSDETTLVSIVESMRDTLAHRGPDDSGTWIDPGGCAALGFRRLAILDLSPCGHQPMSSRDTRWMLVFNGEIYNFGELRERLHRDGVAPAWRGHADSEVLLEAIAHWGVPKTLAALNGMFAFAAWDRHEQRLWLARDRVGEKPLYYGRAGDALLFGSELKALVRHPRWSGELEPRAVEQYVRLGYVPAPLSIYRGVWKLPPAHYLSVSLADLRAGEVGSPVAYWSMSAAAMEPRDRLHTDPAEWVDRLEHCLADAVGIRMVADVPLGAFLSGGVDSSVIVALMQMQARNPVRTFSIGFDTAGFDEAPAAARVAAHLGTDHTEMYVTSADALSIVPELPQMYDEPFADSSQVPTALLSRLTKQYVTVALSGDGGDEVFGGYNRYVWTDRIWRRSRRVPRPVRVAAGAALRAVPPARWDAAAEWLHRRLGTRGVAHPGEMVHKLARVLASDSLDAAYTRLASNPVGASLLPGASFDERSLVPATRLSAIERMMLTDGLTYLPDDILAKVDRATMASSLEARVPFLDHRVIEFAWQLPLASKVHPSGGKWVLRQLLARFVPPELTERPKQGFSIPLAQWLRGPLRDWADDLLNPDRLRAQGVFRPDAVRRLWSAHRRGAANHHQTLWTVLMFEAWLDAR